MKNNILTYGLVFFLTVLVYGGGSSLTAGAANHVIEPDSPLANTLPYIVCEIELQEDEDDKGHAKINALVKKRRDKIRKFEPSCYQARVESFTDILLLKSVIIVT
ncbi:hypothetical protein MNBD_NITROSPINAE03-1213 [hydrothermal vent metagenome]|uniref:Uncharacterized protein n=1 Tax=hydrothermal vent metagenome TaxID=652676 RepID=A0A3B1BGE0_9ZZZZ